MARLSEKRRTAIWSAVAKEITDLRVKLAKMANKQHTSYAGGSLPADTVDAELFYLEQRAGKAAISAAEGKKSS